MITALSCLHNFVWAVSILGLEYDLCPSGLMQDSVNMTSLFPLLKSMCCPYFVLLLNCAPHCWTLNIRDTSRFPGKSSRPLVCDSKKQLNLACSKIHYWFLHNQTTLVTLQLIEGPLLCRITSRESLYHNVYPVIFTGYRKSRIEQCQMLEVVIP